MSNEASTRLPSARLRAVLFAALALGAALFLAAPASAVACEEPAIRSELFSPDFHATRAHLEVLGVVVSGAGQVVPPSEWWGEYARAEADGSPPPAGPQWIRAGEGRESLSNFLLWLGPYQEVTNQDAPHVLHHLSPATRYYARFHLQDECGAAEQTFPFATTPISKPEFAEPLRAEQTLGALGPTSAQGGGNHGHAQIENNGAESGTIYAFDYSLPEADGSPPPPESTSWLPFTEAGEGKITEAEDFAAPPRARVTGLQPETHYYLRLRAQNEKGSAEVTRLILTPTARPVVFQPSPRNVTATAVHLNAGLLPHGSETHWRFEYSESAAGPWSPAPAAGTISQAQAEALTQVEEEEGGVGSAEVEGRLTGLTPATRYFVRLFAENAAGASPTPPTAEFTTAGPPSAYTLATVGLHGEALRLLGAVDPNSLPTSEEQLISLGGSPNGGSFALSFGARSATATGSLLAGSSVVTVPLPHVTGTGDVRAQDPEIANVRASSGAFHEGQWISGPGLQAGGARIQKIEGTTIFLSAASEATATVSGAQLTSSEPLPFAAGELISAPGIPAATTITKIEYTPQLTARLTLSAPATATVAEAPLAAALPYDAAPALLSQALTALAGRQGGSVSAAGSPGGPYSVLFDGTLGQADQPQLACDASALQPPGSTCTVQTTQPGGEAYDTSYHFEYIADQQFAADGGAFGPGTQSTPVVDLGSGTAARFVGFDLPPLQAGETYRYRLSATNDSPGDPLVHGAAHALTAPSPPPLELEGPCPNHALRTGPSAALPDCRAYEQITPADKEGSQEIFHYGGFGLLTGATIGEDGDHLELEAPVTWGAGPAAGGPPFFFDRTASGWRPTAATAQPEAGLDTYTAQLFDPNLGALAFQAGYATSFGSGTSKEVQFRLGPPGGPYATAATVPRLKLGLSDGWVAASADFSTLVLQSEDRKLAGTATGTAQGADLYEYSQGSLRWLNQGAGTCGARIARGNEDSGSDFLGTSRGSGQLDAHGNADSLSADGSRVFFEAAPGSDCSAARHLYERIDGAQTVDLGPYRLAAADPQGTRLLLESGGEGPAAGLYLYEDGDFQPRLLAGSAPIASLSNFLVSRDLSTVYFLSPRQLTADSPPLSRPVDIRAAANLYRYDVGAESLAFVGQLGDRGYPFNATTSPDGRYLYFDSPGFAGLPAGGLAPGGGDSPEGQLERTIQVFRYDAAARLLQCLSCASPFDAEPALTSELKAVGAGGSAGPGGSPRWLSVSADGGYAFFQTTAALLPADVDGEITPEGLGGACVNCSGDISPSADVYEWRRPGLDGCARPQGCLALITDGRGGYLNLFLGTAHDGRDVFIYTSSRLLPSDRDTAGDIYDARIGGGFPATSRPVECEGDACFHPPAAPNDETPSSLSYQGPGNQRHAHHRRHRHRRHHRHHHRHAHRSPGGRAAPHNRTGGHR